MSLKKNIPFKTQSKLKNTQYNTLLTINYLIINTF